MPYSLETRRQRRTEQRHSTKPRPLWIRYAANFVIVFKLKICVIIFWVQSLCKWNLNRFFSRTLKVRQEWLAKVTHTTHTLALTLWFFISASVAATLSPLHFVWNMRQHGFPTPPSLWSFTASPHAFQSTINVVKSLVKYAKSFQFSPLSAIKMMKCHASSSKCI